MYVYFVEHHRVAELGEHRLRSVHLKLARALLVARSKNRFYGPGWRVYSCPVWRESVFANDRGNHAAHCSPRFLMRGDGSSRLPKRGLDPFPLKPSHHYY